MAEMPTGEPLDELAGDAKTAALHVLALDAVVAEPPDRFYPNEAPHAVPSLMEQSQDPDLSARFSYVPQAEPQLAFAPQPDVEPEVISEAEGLQRLCSFLEDFTEVAGNSGNEEDRQLAVQAADILQNTTYVSERQLREATATMAQAWKQVLDEDPTKSLYLWNIPGKSNTYVLDRVLGYFDQADVEKYRGRLHFLYDATLTWKNGKWITPVLSPNSEVVMAEDWIDTGRQFSNEYSKIANTVNGPHPAQVSLYLVTASPALIREGAYADGAPANIPVRSHSVSRLAADDKSIHSGLHSSTDDRFEVPIGNMVTCLRNKYGRQDAAMPPLTNIVRSYRQPDYVPSNIERIAQTYGEQYQP